MKPVFIQGTGMASALGIGASAALENIRRHGPPGLRNVGENAGLVPFFSIPFYADGWNKRAERLVQAVVDQACPDASRNGMLIVATSSMDIGAIETGEDPTGLDSLLQKICSWIGWSGQTMVINTACTSGINALASAQALLEQEVVDEVLVLGIELENKLTLGGFLGLQLLSRVGCRPMGKTRDGMVLGEAVAAIRLGRNETNWRMRGAATVIDGSQPTGATAHAVAKMFQMAFSRSGLSSQEIELIKIQAAGGTGNDAAEAAGLRQVFPAECPPLVSFKHKIGHTMGASGVVETVLTMNSCEHGQWPDYPDPFDPDLGITLTQTVPRDVQHMALSILGFGGSHASLVLSRNP